jgi:hypothetical protein
MTDKFKDRFGQEIKIGTKVLCAEYDRNSNIYEGVVKKFTRKFIVVDINNWSARHVSKDAVERQLISIESFKRK